MGVRRADVLDAEHVDENSLNSKTRGEVSATARSARVPVLGGHGGGGAPIATHEPDGTRRVDAANARRRRSTGTASASVAGVVHHLPAAGLRVRELDLDPEPAAAGAPRLPGVGKSPSARQVTMSATLTRPIPHRAPPPSIVLAMVKRWRCSATTWANWSAVAVVGHGGAGSGGGRARRATRRPAVSKRMTVAPSSAPAEPLRAQWPAEPLGVSLGAVGGHRAVAGKHGVSSTRLVSQPVGSAPVEGLTDRECSRHQVASA